MIPSRALEQYRPSPLAVERAGTYFRRQGDFEPSQRRSSTAAHMAPPMTYSQKNTSATFASTGGSPL